MSKPLHEAIVREYAKIKNKIVAQIWLFRVPESVDKPYLIFTPIANTIDSRTTDSECRIHVIQFTAFSGTDTEAAAIIKQVADHFDGNDFTVADGEVLYCRRQVDLMQQDDDSVFQSFAQYDILIERENKE